MCHWCLLWSLTATFQQIVMGQAGRIHYKLLGEKEGGEEEEEIGWSQEVCNKLDFYCQCNEENHVNVPPVHITFMLRPRSERNPRLWGGHDLPVHRN